MKDVTEIKTRHKGLLSQIREKGDPNYGGYDGARGYSENREDGANGNTGGMAEGFGESNGTRKTFEQNDRTSSGYDTGTRPDNSGTGGSIQGIDDSTRQSEPPVKSTVSQMTPEQKVEHIRALDRDRKRVKREAEAREKELSELKDRTGQASPPPRLSGDDVKQTPPGFRLKLPFQGAKAAEKTRLFTQKEVDAEIEHMTFIYFQGSGLLDDVLEIVVKDHEPVTIWQMAEEEADMFARMHLESAKTDEASARSARVLLAAYNRIYTAIYLGPRLKATNTHVRDHGGWLHGGITFK